MTQRVRDFRSDTVTQPTEAMRAAMAGAVVGDDILGEDPTVRRLEALAAERFGKEAALFVISGTMANQVAVMTATQRGDEIIVDDASHLFNLEAGGLAALSGVQARALRAEAGRLTPETLRQAIRPGGLQSPVTRMLCLENTHDLNRGIPLPADYLREIAEIAHAQRLTVYLDGARIFNAAVSLGTPVDQLCAPVDCLQCCLSKGLAAPVGALLIGSRAFVERARWVRQRLGGGMRQAGHIAAAGIVALDEMVARLADDHAHARRLSDGLAAIDRRLVDTALPMTNIVAIDFGAAGLAAGPVVGALAAKRILVRQIDERRCRMVTHHGLDNADVDAALAALREALGA